MLRAWFLRAIPALALAISACSSNDNNGTTNPPPPPPPPGGLAVSFTPCSGGGYWGTIFVAVRNGTGPWKALTAAGGSYSTTLDSTLAQFVTVTASGTGDYEVQLLYALPSEVKNFTGYGCGTPLYTASGTVNNLAAGEEALISAGWSSSAVFGPGNKSFSTQATALTNDMLGVLMPTPGVVSKMILRRGVAYNAVAAFDFTSNEAFAAQTPSMTVSGNGSDPVTFAEWYQTAAGFREDIIYNSPSTTLPTSYWGMPAAKQLAGDLHELYLYTTNTVGNLATTRTLDGYFHDPAARTMAFPAVTSTPTVTRASGTPYARLRAQYQLPAGHKYVYLLYYPNSGNNDLSVDFFVTAGYLGGTSVDMTFPDLSTITGWNNAWMPPAGVTANWGFYDYALPNNGAPFAAVTDGTVFQITSWRSTIGP